MPRIAVIGSMNMDLVVETAVSPQMGETVLGDNFFTTPGGKGANQAVAAARLGGEVAMFGTVGHDPNGVALVENLKSEGIQTNWMNTVANVSTGVAIIEIQNGHNRIIVAPGANQWTNTEYLSSIAETLLSFDIVILQLEVPLEAVEFIVNKLSGSGRTIILNPAPAVALSEEVIAAVTYITPNEHEYKIVLGTTKSAEEALQLMPNKLLITCGAAGVKYFNGEQVVTVPSIKIDVVDTTGAGDTFTGAFGVAIGKGYSLHEAIRFANIAAGLSTTKLGAQTGMPTLAEVEGYS
jgi:ribokinase